ncbi:MAG TPA: wax ester/triacylglycerol synthase domain-containing protein [Acidimicrobiales bacterium]|nr:wax ester/triacylglycerol synthase domain-containing protein [Acidimicrobiales bacterium]
MADTIHYENRMSDADALMWSIEKDPLLRSTITAVAMLDKAPDRATFEARLERGTRQVPRLRQRVVSNPFSLAPPRWEVDPNFDARFHIRWVKAAGDGSLAEVCRMAEPVAMQGFDRARPLWETVVVEGLAGGGAALVLKLHHAITDGVGAVKIALVLFDLEAEPGDLGPMPEAPEVRVLSQPERVADALDHQRRRALGRLRRFPAIAAAAASAVAADPVGAARGVAEAAGSVARMLAPANEPLSPVMTARSLSVHFDTVSVPLEELKAAGRVAGGRLNDAFVAAVLGGWRRYHEAHDAYVESLRMAMPINVRNEASAEVAGNQFAPTRFLVPLGIDDPVERMRAVRELVAAQRAEPALALVDPFASIINRLPTTVSTGLFGSMLKGVDFTTSNVPGVPVPVFVAGAQMVSQFAFGPLSGAAANLTLVSYLDQVHVGINSDPAAVPDPDVLHQCMVEGFEEILKTV